MSKSLKAAGLKFGTIYFGAGGSVVLAFADILKAFKASEENNPEQLKLYSGAAFFGGVAAFATAAGGSVALSLLTATKVALWTLGWNPVLWLGVAALAVVVAVYFSVMAGNAEHGPIEILLKHSAWGRTNPMFSNEGEIAAWRSLQYSPQVSAVWESINGAAGRLELRCVLPFVAMGEAEFLADFKVRLNGKLLSSLPFDEAVAYSGSSFGLETHFLVSTIMDDAGVARGWIITMHESAQVELEYLYRPDIKSQPTFALQQPDAPSPLVFTSSGWFSETIDPAKLAPVRKPI